MKFKFVNKNSMPNPAESLRYIKCYILSSPRPFKSPSNSITYMCQNISSLSRRPDTVLKIRENATFLKVIKNPIIYKFVKESTNHRIKTNMAVICSHKSLSKHS